MHNLRKPFLRLHWKLTLSYTLVTVAALLVVQIIVAILLWAIVTNSSIYPRALIAVLKGEIAPQIAVYLDNPEPDINGLAGWLQAAETSAGLTFQSLNFPVAEISLTDFDENTNLLVLDKNLNYLAGVPASIDEDHETILEQANMTLQAALSGEDDPNQIAQVTPNHSMTVAVPVMNKNNQLLGIVLLKTMFPPRGILIGIMSYIGGSLIFFTIAAGFVGTIFGFVTARGLTRRLRRVNQAADQWSKGDFSTFIQDRSGDELSQLAGQLNRMAEQLQNLVQTKQELASLEERNRLARDLHDSVKQQVFATTMQVGAARAEIDQDAQAAREHLDEAEKLSRQAQSELNAIIRELQPESLRGRQLNQALRECVEDWSRQNMIPAEVSLEEGLKLPLEVEQTLFRITQEALSNITKHSAATKIEVHLYEEKDNVMLVISDNGKGFDIEAAAGKGVGLRSMRERIESLDGSLLVESTIGEGTRLIAKCQVNEGGAQ